MASDQQDAIQAQRARMARHLLAQGTQSNPVPAYYCDVGEAYLNAWAAYFLEHPEELERGLEDGERGAGGRPAD